MSNCTNGRMGLSHEKEDYMGIRSFFFCPSEDFNYVLKGNGASKEQKFISISLRKCNQTYLDSKYGVNNRTCKPFADTVNLVASLKFYLILRNSYFDETDYSDNPTPTFLKPFFLAGRYNGS